MRWARTTTSWFATRATRSFLLIDGEWRPSRPPSFVIECRSFSIAMLVSSALISGLGLGSMYGLLALGFHVTHAVSNTVNFAQGSAMMLGAVLCFTFWVTFQWPLTLAVPVSLLLCAVWSVAVERIAVRPFVRTNSSSWLMATVALGIVLENVVLFTFGKEPRGMPAGLLTSNSIVLAG